MAEWMVQNTDVLSGLREWHDNTFHCVVTSPPYWGLRDYGIAGQLGNEPTPEAFVAGMVAVFAEVRRVLRSDGTCWLNLGDSYAAGKCGRSDHGSGDPTSRLGPKRDGLPGGTPPGPIMQRAVPDGLKPKDLVGIPWRVALALQADGWYLRSDIIWHKPNPMPESVTDRPTRSHEYLFLLTKSERYYYNKDLVLEPSVAGHGSGNGFKRDARLTYTDANGARGSDTPWTPRGGSSFKRTGSKRGIEHLGHQATHREDREHVEYNGPTRNCRDVWTISTKPYRGAHFAVFPEALVAPCILAGCPPHGSVLDPFCGSGTTLKVANDLDRNSVGIELNPEYIPLIEQRIEKGIEDRDHVLAKQNKEGKGVAGIGGSRRDKIKPYVSATGRKVNARTVRLIETSDDFIPCADAAD